MGDDAALDVVEVGAGRSHGTRLHPRQRARLVRLPHLLRGRLAAAGRLSLTNYLLSSLTFALIFYGWGLGWFGMLTRWQAFAVALVPVTLMLIWSPLWLARFRQGPFEWLWRSVARGRFGPILR